MYELKKTFRVSGTEKEAFAQQCREIDAATICVKVKKENFLLYYYDANNKRLVSVTDNPYDTFFALENDEVKNNVSTSKTHPDVFNEGLGDMVFASVVDENGLDYGLIPVDPVLLTQMGFCGIAGPFTYKPASYTLLCCIQHELPSLFTAVIRKHINSSGETGYKLFNLRSSQYMRIPQDDISEIGETIVNDPDDKTKCGKMKRWSMDQYKTEAEYYFDGINCSDGVRSYTPFLTIETSDTGNSACAFNVGWLLPNGLQVYLGGNNNATRIHRGEWSKAKAAYISDAKKLKEKLTALPQKMLELDAVVIGDADMETVVSNWLKQLKFGKKISEQILCDVNGEHGKKSFVSAGEIIRTIYDYAPNYMEKMNEDTRKIFGKALGELPYARINTLK